jgi:hypothetical protein
MVRRCVFLAGVFAVATCVILVAVVSSTAQDKSPRSLMEQVQMLQNRVVQLEARVAALDKRPSGMVLPLTSMAPGPRIEPVPKGWQPADFNGLRYYIAPLGDQKK